MNAPQVNQPIMVGTRFIYLNKEDVLDIRIKDEAADAALAEINKVSSLATPSDPKISKGRYDEDYLKTVLLSSTPRGLRELLVNPHMAEYVEEVYNLEIADDNTRLDKQQKEGLKNLDLKFVTNQQHGQDELTYINNLVDHYVEDVLPVLEKFPQFVLVTNKDGNTEEISLTKSIILI